MTIPEPGQLRWTEVPDPQPRPDDVLIKIAATAVNRADLLQVAGHYPAPPGAPEYPGLECSGTVMPGGQQVCALLSGGGYAEQVAVPAGQVLPLPRGMDLVTAAALPEVACTVWSNLTQVAGLRAGETVLIHGGGSGIGTFAIQYAKALGAHVITTARPGKHRILRELGADRCIDYTSADFTDARADVVLDIIGAAYLDHNLAALKPDGRLVIIGLQGGRRAELDLGRLLSRRLTIAGTTLRSRPPADKAKIVQGVRETVWPLLESGAIKPVIDRTLPISQAPSAHQLVQQAQHVGKVVLRVW